MNYTYSFAWPLSIKTYRYSCTANVIETARIIRPLLLSELEPTASEGVVFTHNGAFER